MKKLIFAIFLIFIIGNATSQSVVLDAYIKAGLESNSSLKQQDLELQKALKAIDLVKSNLYPKIAFNPNYTLAAGGRRLEFPIGDLLNPVYSTLNALTKTNNFPQVENVSELLAPHNFHDTRISFQMPVYNADIRNNIALQKQILTTEQSKKKFLMFELKSNIEAAYYQFLQANEALGIFEKSILLRKEFVDLNEKLVKNQVALKDAVLSAQYELSKLEQQYLEAQKNRELARSYFNFLLNKDLNTEILIDSTIINALPVVGTIDFYQNWAQSNRPEFEQINSGKLVNLAVLHLQQKNEKLPQVFLSGNTGFQGYGYKFNNQAYLIAQIGLNWDLFHGYEKKHKIAQTKIEGNILDEKQKQVRQMIELQVKQKYLETQTAQSNLKPVQEAIQKTEKILELTESRYKNGNALVIEVNTAQNEVLIARLTASIARYALWTKYADLKKASGI